MPRLILASQSPRRCQLMSDMGLEFETIPSNHNEQLDESRHVEDVAKELSFGKAAALPSPVPQTHDTKRSQEL